jgi:hypothetical protein
LLDWFFYFIFNYKQNNMQQQFNLPLDQTTPLLCEECNHDQFTQVFFLRKISKFIAGTEQDGLVPIPSFACTKCGHVNDEFKPKIEA